MDTPDPIRNFADEAFRKALCNPLNLKAFLRRATPDIVDGFDFDRMEVIDRNFLTETWRRRESDLLFEIPYRTTNETVAEVLVCVLLEHQSQTDWRMAFRTLHYAVLYWARQLQTWEETEETTRGSFRFRPVLPIVLYAASTPWGSARTFADLVGGPEPLRAMAPGWSPLFWELGRHDARELLNSQEAFDQFLAVVRAEDATTAEFEPILREAFERIQQTQQNRLYLSNMLEIVYLWALWRRPEPEQPRWNEVVETMVRNKADQERLKAMTQTMGHRLYQEGIAEGKAAGIAEGELLSMRNAVLRFGRRRLGEPNEEQAKMIADCVVLATLELWFDRLPDAASWVDVLKAE